MVEIDIKLPYKLPSYHDWQPHASFYHPMYAGSIDGTDLFPHDRAVVRAMLSTYKPNKNVAGDQSKTLFIARLSKDTSQGTIKNIFEKYGELEKCRLIRDFVTGFSRGYAFVEFKRKKDAMNAARETHDMNVDGKKILVDFECERDLEGWKPRRFGGGFGGRKESGQLRFGGIDRPFRRPIPEKVSHFNRGIQHEGTVRFEESGRDEEKTNRDCERHGMHERGHVGRNKDSRGHVRDKDHRDRRGYKSNDRDNRAEDKDHRERKRGNRDYNKDYDNDYKSTKRYKRDYKDRDYRDKKEYRDTQRDYERRDRRDRDNHNRERDDCYRSKDDRRRDRDDRYRDQKYKDKEDSRDTRGEIRSDTSNSSRDPD